MFLAWVLVGGFFFMPYDIYSLSKLHALLENHFAFIQLFGETAAKELFFFLSQMQIFRILIILTSAFMLFCSFKLRRLNQQIQLREILATPAYILLFQSIRNAVTQEELYSRYCVGVRNNPEVASFLKKKFKEKKMQLSSR